MRAAIGDVGGDLHAERIRARPGSHGAPDCVAERSRVPALRAVLETPGSSFAEIVRTDAPQLVRAAGSRWGGVGRRGRGRRQERNVRSPRASVGAGHRRAVSRPGRRPRIDITGSRIRQFRDRRSGVGFTLRATIPYRNGTVRGESRPSLRGQHAVAAPVAHLEAAGAAQRSRSRKPIHAHVATARLGPGDQEPEREPAQPGHAAEPTALVREHVGEASQRPLPAPGLHLSRSETPPPCPTARPGSPSTREPLRLGVA